MPTLQDRKQAITRLKSQGITNPLPSQISEEARRISPMNNVPTPMPTTPPAPTTQQPSITPTFNPMQSERYQTIVQKYGAPSDIEQQNLYYRMAFTPQELRQYGLDRGFQDLSGQVTQARANLGATPAPTNTNLRILQEALNAKQNIVNQPLGESDLFKQAGISGYGALAQSLAERSREMEDKYNSFRSQISDVSGAMVDTYNLALNKYKLLKDEYDTEVTRQNKLLDDLTLYERQLDLLRQKSQLEREEVELKNALKAIGGGRRGGGGSGGFTSQERRKLEQAGLLNAERDRQLNFLYGTKQEQEGAITEQPMSKDEFRQVAEEQYQQSLSTSRLDQLYQEYLTDFNANQPTTSGITFEDF